jgi:hypothetical protein
MNIKFESSTTAQCKNYLKIIYDEREYSLEEFSNKYKTNDFSLDIKLKECILVYRGRKMTYEEIGKSNTDFSEDIYFLRKYVKEIYPIEHSLFISNRDYYKASKYINKFEKCLQTARYYLLSSHDLIKTDFEFNWNNGYGLFFLIRTMDFTTSVVWYNSCFDYMLLTIYFAFGVYTKMDGYSDEDSHETLLKRCTYYSLGEIYSKYKTVPNYKTLWKIINSTFPLAKPL